MSDVVILVLAGIAFCVGFIPIVLKVIKRWRG